jgi:NADH-quinone oxidoreductase subunit G
MVKSNGSLAGADWNGALEAAAAALHGKRVHVIASPMLSNETLYLLSRLIAKTGGTGVFTVERGSEEPLPGVKDLALRADRAANVRGAELFGLKRTDTVSPRDGDAVVLAGVAMDAVAVPATVALVDTLYDAARSAAAVLPIANMAEEEGTFTNLRGRVQRFMQAKAPPGFARSSWSAVADLLFALGDKTNYFTASEVFDSLASERKEFNGLSYDKLGMRGLPVR